MKFNQGLSLHFFWLFLFKMLLVGLCLVRCTSVLPLEQNNYSIPQTPCERPIKAGLLSQTIKGQSFVAPPDSFGASTLKELHKLGANWIAALPYAYFSDDQATIQTFDGGWWGEKSAGIRHTISLAHQEGLQVMLKPQLWNHKLWIGALNFENSADWDKFHEAYTQFILDWALLAEQQQVAMFCIGTELKYSVVQHPQYWRALISKIKSIYKGPLTYASNWDNYHLVQFWDLLDYIGTDAYFSLTDAQTPTVCALIDAWQPIVRQLAEFSVQWKKPILFTEFGYMSVDGCAYRTWELEAKRAGLNSNQLAQANALQALFETFAPAPWWKGGFMWKWYPNTNSAWGEGKRSKDYTPQGKLAEQLLKIMYRAS